LPSGSTKDAEQAGKFHVSASELDVMIAEGSVECLNDRKRIWRQVGISAHLQEVVETSRPIGTPKRSGFPAWIKNARAKAAEGFHSEAQWLARVAFYGWRCAYCDIKLTPFTLTKDHRIPLSKRGSDWPANLVPACKRCNSWKKDRRITIVGKTLPSCPTALHHIGSRHKQFQSSGLFSRRASRIE
jgi:hypothetical protein